MKVNYSCQLHRLSLCLLSCSKYCTVSQMAIRLLILLIVISAISYCPLQCIFCLFLIECVVNCMSFIQLSQIPCNLNGDYDIFS